MLSFAARRIVLSLPVLLLGTMIVFALVSLRGDPLDAIRGQPGVSADTIRTLEAEYHLDQPVPVRYVRWLGDFVRGDWGTSYDYRRPVSDVILRALPNSLLLLVAATALSTAVGVAFGIWGAVRQHTAVDHATTAFAFFGISMPVFLLGLLLQLALVVVPYRMFGIRLLYLQGKYSPGNEGSLLDLARHMALPVLTLAIANAAVLSRFQRAGMLAELTADYLRTAAAKGLSLASAVVRHALRNALVPVVTLTAVNMAALVGGAVVIERIFSWPGMGTLFLEALASHDYPIVLSWLAVTSGAVVVANALADLAHGALDPRVRAR